MVVPSLSLSWNTHSWSQQSGQPLGGHLQSQSDQITSCCSLRAPRSVPKCCNSVNTQTSLGFPLSALGLQITLEDRKKPLQPAQLMVKQGGAVLPPLKQPLLSCLPYLSLPHTPPHPRPPAAKSKKQMCLGERLHHVTPPVSQNPPICLQEFMTITSKIPIILSLLSECFFQFLTLIKTGLSLKITDHITLLTETVQRSLVILLIL